LRNLDGGGSSSVKHITKCRGSAAGITLGWGSADISLGWGSVGGPADIGALRLTGDAGLGDAGLGDAGLGGWDPAPSIFEKAMNGSKGEDWWLLNGDYIFK
jgi:hypothetical protein